MKVDHIWVMGCVAMQPLQTPEKVRAKSTGQRTWSVGKPQAHGKHVSILDVHILYNKTKKI